MLNFVYDIPVKMYFGEGQLAALPSAIRKFGERVFIVTYREHSSAEKIILRQVEDLLESAGIGFLFFYGAEPNPLISSVVEGVDLCRSFGANSVLAIGGGSAIDCAKAIAAAFYYSGDPWELMSDNNRVEKALPIGCILTIAAAGSEMNHTAVISNAKTHEKLHLFNDLIYPSYAILDPTFTYTVPHFQTACGCADIVCHAMEVYFANTPDTYVQNRIAEGLMKTVIHYTAPVLKNPFDYEARANIMWASSLAISKIVAYGKLIQWSSHYIEHTVSAYYDVPHGAGMAVIFPVWLDYILSETTLNNFTDFATNVWGILPSDDPLCTARSGIEALRTYFFETLKLPSTLRELGVEKNKLEILARSAVSEGPIKGTQLLHKEHVLEILERAF